METERKVFDLGWAVARATKDGFGGCKVEIASFAQEGESVFIPAQSVSISRKEDLQALRDACDFALTKDDKP